jgi:hypothetical protein
MKLNKRRLQSMARRILTEAEDIDAAASKAFASLDQDVKDETDMSKRLKNKSDATPAALKQIVDGAKKAAEGKKDLDKMKAEMKYYTLRGVTYQMRNGKGTYTIKTLDGETTTLDASKVGAAPSEEIKKVAKVSKTVSQSASKAANKSSKAGGNSSGKSSDKTKNIQKIVGAEPDGKWGSDTSTKWSEWISSEEGMRGVAALAKEKGKELKESKTLKRLELRNLLETSAFFPYLSEAEESNPETSDTESDSVDAVAGKKTKMEIPGNVKTYVDNNKGSAATIAKALGYAGNLSGVNQLANDIKSKTANTEDKGGKQGESNTKEASDKPFSAVSFKDVDDMLGKKSTSANAPHTIRAIPIEYIKSKKAFQSIAFSKSNIHPDVDDFLESDSGTRDYFDKVGKTQNGNHNLIVSSKVSETKSIGDQTYDVFDLFVDGTALYNAAIKGYTFVKQSKSEKIYAVPIKDVESSKVALKESAREENLNLLRTLRKYKII